MAIAARAVMRRGFAAKSVAGVVVVALLIGWSIYSRTQGRDQLEERVHADMVEIIIAAPEHPDAPLEYMQTFDLEHRQAFANAYTMGGRRSSGRFDSDKYLSVVLGALIAHAKASGYEADAVYFEETLALNLAN